MQSAQEAVLLPALIALGLWQSSRERALPPFSALLFIAGCALSVVFSLSREVGDQQSVHCLPGYALLVLLVPKQYQPSWRQAFGLSFASMLIADLWGAITYFYSTGPIPPSFYYGIGGAGFEDALSLTPWLLAISMAQIEWLRRKGLADQTVPALLRSLGASLLKSAEPERQ
jgi:hypothetical protein